MLSALPVFEAAARHQSFTRASQELNISQPTVSHHIRRIEDALECEVFSRDHNRLRLTAAGEQLATAVALGFGHVEQEARAIQANLRPEGLTLACSFGFANGWLMPRFSGLRQAIGEYPVHVAATDWLSGFDRDTADLIVVWTGDQTSEHERVPLFPEVVTPVCSPEFLARHPTLLDPRHAETLLTLPLMHYDERDSQFMNWQSWFARWNIAYELPRDRYVFSNYDFMIQAVAEGEGVGLGWVHLIEDLLQSGKLVRIGQPIQGEKTAYSLEIRRGRVADDVLDQVGDWFRQEVG